jgi:predicted nucleic acid-binding protein
MAKYSVIYDACVLYPAPLRDLLMQLAMTELFRARWTEAIHREWISSLLKKEPHRTREKLERTRALMNQSVPDCLVDDYDHLIEAITLPDPNDRHVVAAAIHAGCDAIVTFNLKDFPAEVLEANGLEAIHPDDFVVNQFDLDAARVVNSAREIRARDPASRDAPADLRVRDPILVHHGKPRHGYARTTRLAD